jgi:WD40 repeat protein
MVHVGRLYVFTFACLCTGAKPQLAGADDKAALPAFVRVTCKGHTAELAAVSFSPDGKQLATASFDRTVRLWEATTGKPVRTLTGHQDLVLSVSYRGDGKQVASGSSDKTARIWEPVSGKELFALKHPNIVDVVAFNPAGDQLATAGHDGVLRFWDPAKGTQIREIKAHTTANLTAIYCLAWSKDGKQIATGGLDQSVKLWDAAGGKLVREFKAYKPKEFEQGHREGVFAVALSPDGKILASTGSDRMAKIWTIADGKMIHDLTDPRLTPAAPPKDVLVPVMAHSGWIHAARFAADGQRLLTGGAAPARLGSLAIWTVNDGKLEKSFEMPTGPIHGLDISSDGRFVALACGPSVRGADDSLAFIIELPQTATVQAPGKAKP